MTAAKCGKSCLPQDAACAASIVLLFLLRTMNRKESLIHAFDNELVALAVLLALGRR